MADIDKLAVEDRVRYSFRISPKDIDKTCQAVCIENDLSDPVPVSFAIAGTSKIISGDQSAVIAGINQTVVSYTVPVGKTFVLYEVSGTSTNKSKFSVEVDGAEVKRKNNYYTDYNVDFRFYGADFTEGQVITLKIFHNRGSSADLQGSIIGREI